MAGGKPKGAPKTGGRLKGTPNKLTADVKALAGKYGPGAIRKLAELADLVPGAHAAESEQARVAALKEILDRAYGKARQDVTLGDPDGKPLGITVQFVKPTEVVSINDMRKKGESSPEKERA